MLITSLPDEILLIIIEHILSTSRSKFEDGTTPRLPPALSIVKVSHINRKFRRVALSNPQLWTHISGCERRPKMGLVKACLKRSRNLPLTVHLYVYIDPLFGRSCDKVLKAAKPHSPRWRSVIFRFAHISWSSESRIRRFAEGDKETQRDPYARA